jgi:hypothetical protein
MATARKVSLNLPPRLLAGEKMLHFKPMVWAISGKSLPSYRVSLSLPLIQEVGLCVTDRRVLLTCWLLRLIRFEWSAWFTGEDKTADQDHLETIAVGRSAFLGPYLELITSNPVVHWWRSRKARIRLYMKSPELVRPLISEVLGPTTPSSEPDGAANGSKPIRSETN